MIKTKLMPHQEECFNKLKDLKCGALFMDMGTGKTLTIFKIAEHKINKGKASHLTFFCPCSVKHHIRNEAVKHGFPLDKLKIYGTQSVSSKRSVYSDLENILPTSICVVDESHYIKNHKALRTDRLIRMAHRLASSRFVMTGTEMPNGAKDLFAQFFFLSPELLGYQKYSQFEARHLEWRVVGKGYKEKLVIDKYRAANMEYISQRTSNHVFYCKKDDVLELPQKNYQVRYVEPCKIVKEAYNIAKNEILLDSNSFSVNDCTIYRLFTALHKISSGYWHKSDVHYRKGSIVDIEDNYKIKELLEVISQIPKEKKVVIWCAYQQEVEDIKDVLGNDAVTLYGNDKASISIDEFKNKKRFLITTFGKGGEGVEYPFAEYAIFYSRNFDYGDRSQAEDRQHRKGIFKPPVYIDLITNTGIDKLIHNCLNKKKDAIKHFKKEFQERGIECVKNI